MNRATLICLAALSEGCVAAYDFDYHLGEDGGAGGGPSSGAWVVQLAGSIEGSDDRVRPGGPRALAADATHVYFVGTTNEPIEGCDGFGDLTGQLGSFVVALDRATGTEAWCKATTAWNDANAPAVSAIAAGADGVVVASPSGMVAAGENQEGFTVARLGADGGDLGTVESARVPHAKVRVSDVGVLAGGEILVAANVEDDDALDGDLTFDTCSVPFARRSPFLVAIDAGAGTCSWSTAFESATLDLPEGFDLTFAIDADGNQSVAAFTAHGSFTFGGQAGQADPFAMDDVSYAGFAAPLDPTAGSVGPLLPLGWVYLPGLAGDPMQGSLRATPGGSGRPVLLSASLIGDPFDGLCPNGCAFDPAAHGFNVILGEVGPTAISEHARFGGSGDENVQAIAADPSSGAVWVTGTYTLDSDLAPDEAHEPNADPFVARIEGAIVERMSFHTAAAVIIDSVLALEEGVVVTGSVDGDMDVPGGSVVIPDTSNRNAFVLFLPRTLFSAGAP